MAAAQDNVNLDNPSNTRLDSENRSNPKVTHADHPSMRASAPPDAWPSDQRESPPAPAPTPVTAPTPAAPMILEVAAAQQPGSAVVPPVIAEPPIYDTHAQTIRDPRVTMIGDSTSHRDPFSGESGTHAVGVSIGATAGGAVVGAASGWVAGAVAGPLGMAIGAAAGTIVGAMAGGYAGKEVAEKINPTTEDHFWRNHYLTREYVPAGARYEEFEPAYLHGIQMRERLIGQTWDEAEPEIRAAWEKKPHAVIMDWHRARAAVQDAWDHLTPEPAEPETTEEERNRDE